MTFPRPWKTRDGRIIALRDMADRHLESAVQMLRTNGFNEYSPEYASRDELEEELARRAAAPAPVLALQVDVRRFAELDLDPLPPPAPLQRGNRFAELDIGPLPEPVPKKPRSYDVKLKAEPAPATAAPPASAPRTRRKLSKPEYIRAIAEAKEFAPSNNADEDARATVRFLDDLIAAVEPEVQAEQRDADIEVFSGAPGPRELLPYSELYASRFRASAREKETCSSCKHAPHSWWEPCPVPGCKRCDQTAVLTLLEATNRRRP